MKKWVNGPRPNGNSFKEYLDNANDYFINQWIPSRFSYGVKEYETEICLEHRDRPFAPLEATIQPYSCRLETVTYKAYYEFDGERFGVKERKLDSHDDSVKSGLDVDAREAKDKRIQQVQTEFYESYVEQDIKCINYGKNHTFSDDISEIKSKWISFKKIINSNEQM